MNSYSTLLVERDGPVGWLVRSIARGRATPWMPLMLDELEEAWRELDQDPAVRVIVNTGAGRHVPDRPRCRPAQSESRCPAQAVRPHAPCRAALDVLAERSVEAGHRGGERDVRRRRAALCGRCRHRAGGVRRDVPRYPRVRGTGGGLRADRTGPAHALRGGPAHGPGRTARAHVGRTCAGARA